MCTGHSGQFIVVPMPGDSSYIHQLNIYYTKRWHIYASVTGKNGIYKFVWLTEVPPAVDVQLLQHCSKFFVCHTALRFFVGRKHTPAICACISIQPSFGGVNIKLIKLNDIMCYSICAFIKPCLVAPEWLSNGSWFYILERSESFMSQNSKYSILIKNWNLTKRTEDWESELWFVIITDKSCCHVVSRFPIHCNDKMMAVQSAN